MHFGGRRLWLLFLLLHYLLPDQIKCHEEAEEITAKTSTKLLQIEVEASTQKSLEFNVYNKEVSELYRQDNRLVPKSLPSSSYPKNSKTNLENLIQSTTH